MRFSEEKAATLKEQTMSHRFDEAKATCLAIELLELAGGEMDYYTLLKLMYLVDREALNRFGRPISTDTYVSMDSGPVLSGTYDLIKGEGHTVVESDVDGDTITFQPGAWGQNIETRERFRLRLKAHPSEDKLAGVERELIRAVYRKYGHLTGGRLKAITHALPEYKEPVEGGPGSTPLYIEDILRGLGKSEIYVQEMRPRATAEQAVESMFT